jgi:hypothetical protein
MASSHPAGGYPSQYPQDRRDAFERKIRHRMISFLCIPIKPCPVFIWITAFTPASQVSDLFPVRVCHINPLRQIAVGSGTLTSNTKKDKLYKQHVKDEIKVVTGLIQDHIKKKP